MSKSILKFSSLNLSEIPFNQIKLKYDEQNQLISNLGLEIWKF